MKINMALGDRIVRGALAVAAGVLLLTGILSGTLGIVLGIVAVVFLGTAIAGFCPLYALLGLSTKRVKAG